MIPCDRQLIELSRTLLPIHPLPWTRSMRRRVREPRAVRTHNNRGEFIFRERTTYVHVYYIRANYTIMEERCCFHDDVKKKRNKSIVKSLYVRIVFNTFLPSPVPAVGSILRVNVVLFV